MIFYINRKTSNFEMTCHGLMRCRMIWSKKGGGIVIRKRSFYPLLIAVTSDRIIRTIKRTDLGLLSFEACAKLVMRKEVTANGSLAERLRIAFFFSARGSVLAYTIT